MTASAADGVAGVAPTVLPRGARHPFALWVSLVRNPLRTAPMMVATLVASLGIASVVVLADSLLRTALAPNDFLREAVLVRSDGPTLDAVTSYLRTSQSAAATTRLGPQTFIRGKMLQFDTFFPVLLVPDGQAATVAALYHERVAVGRLPAAGALELAVPAGLATSRNLRIGDTVGGGDDYTPYRLTVVGFLEGPRWIAIAPTSALRAAGATGPDSLLVYERDQAGREAAERAIHTRFGVTATVVHWTPREDGKDDSSYGDDLQLMLSFIIAMNAAVLSIIGGLLALLYFRQRQPEFVILSVLGRSKLDLALQAIGEIAIVVGFGWLAGIASGWGLMSLLQGLVFSQRAIIIDLEDVTPLLYTVPLALSTILVSATVTVVALARFDPIARLQARG